MRITRFNRVIGKVVVLPWSQDQPIARQYQTLGRIRDSGERELEVRTVDDAGWRLRVTVIAGLCGAIYQDSRAGFSRNGLKQAVRINEGNRIGSIPDTPANDRRKILRQRRNISLHNRYLGHYFDRA